MHDIYDSMLIAEANIDAKVVVYASASWELAEGLEYRLDSYFD
jgi:hypothetical protein